MLSLLRKSGKSGVALISALMVLVIMAIIAGCFAQVMSRDARLARDSGFSIVTLNSAQAGIDYAIWLHKHNLAYYPVIDYSGNSDDTRRNNQIPAVYNAGQDEHRAYDINPLRGTIYNLPCAGLTNASGESYTPVRERKFQQNGTVQQDALYNNELSSGDTMDTEYLFVTDLSFAGGTNFLADTSYCATFQIREQVDDTNGVLHIMSTGKLRRVPSGYDWQSTGTSANWLNFVKGLTSSEVGSITSSRLDELGFDEVASRTVSVDLNFSSMALSGTVDYPAGAGINMSSTNPATRQMEIPEGGKREWFR